MHLYILVGQSGIRNNQGERPMAERDNRDELTEQVVRGKHLWDQDRGEHTPSPHNRRIYTASPWPQELRDFWPARPAWQCLVSDSCSSAHGLRSTLPPHGRSPFRSCASLRSLWPAHGRTCTSRSAPVPGAHRDRGEPIGSAPPTPPGMRVRTGRFEKLRFHESLGTPNRSK